MLEEAVQKIVDGSRYRSRWYPLCSPTTIIFASSSSASRNAGSAFRPLSADPDRLGALNREALGIAPHKDAKTPRHQAAISCLSSLHPRDCSPICKSEPPAGTNDTASELVGLQGLEPGTLGLKVPCSTR